MTKQHGTIKTELVLFNFDTINNPKDREAWKLLLKAMLADGRREFRALGDYYCPFRQIGLGEEFPIELETKHLFSDQWNTAPIAGDVKAPTGRRVFDFATDAGAPRGVMRGHYVRWNEHMVQARAKRVACGWCGHQEETGSGREFHTGCYGGAHLTEGELHLTRLLPVMASWGAKRDPLTDEERARLMPVYLDAQTTGSNKRNAERARKDREDTESEYRKAIANAEAEHTGKVWLLDRGFTLENVIYYRHKGRFSFGWRGPLGPELRSRLLDVLSEFPCEYDITGED